VQGGVGEVLANQISTLSAPEVQCPAVRKCVASTSVPEHRQAGASPTKATMRPDVRVLAVIGFAVPDRLRRAGRAARAQVLGSGDVTK
jgi:hypothetical protein